MSLLPPLEAMQALAFHAAVRPRRPRPSRPRRALGRLPVETLEERRVPASLSISDVSILEGNAGTHSALVTVSLSGSSNQQVTVDYSTGSATAQAGSDFQAVSGRLTFNKGQTSKSIAVPVIGDTLVELDEVFFVNLSNAKHATIADGQGAVTILNDDTLIRVDDVVLAEGNSGTTNFVFPVSLSVAISEPVTLLYTTADGTATAGSDYRATSGKLTIPAGQTSGTITVAVNGDQLSEPDETFFVNLSNATAGAIARGQAVGTILDDEPHVSIEDVATAEGNAGTTDFTFVVSLSVPAPTATVTVQFATSDVTATTADNDYQAASGTVTFAPGETSKTVVVQVNGDTAVEPDEFFAVTLSNASNAQLGNSVALGTILSDDNAVLHVDSQIGVEPDPSGSDSVFLEFNVWLSTPFTDTVTVDFSTVDGTATAGLDYLPAMGQLTFAPGEASQTIYVQILPDFEYDPDETFSVVLSNPSSNALLQPGWEVGNGTIIDFGYDPGF